MNTPPPPDIRQPPPESPASKRIRREERRQPTPGVGRDWEPEAEGRSTNDAPLIESEDVPEELENGRESMYVRLFKEMIQTVLEAESYLFSPHELWVLNHILNLPYDQFYLLTRLLLRRQGKVHPLASIAPAYSGELGEEGVKRAAKALCGHLDIPDDIIAKPDDDYSGQLNFWNANSGSTKPRKPSTGRHPWSGMPTGLSEEEESADPDLAEAIRQSLWVEQNGDVRPPVAAAAPISTAGPSGYSSSSSQGLVMTGNQTSSSTSIASLFFQAVNKSPIFELAHDEDQLSLDDIMSCVSADDLRRVARKRKVPSQLLATRESMKKALRDIAHNQTTLSFTPVDRKGKGKMGSSSRTLRKVTSTSERLVLAELMPCLGGQVIQIDSSLYRLIARVNLIFSRTPPTSAYSPALLLPPILVASHRRRYPDYGTPTRSVIWKDRSELLDWEHAVHYETLVSEVLGDNWIEQRRGGNPQAAMWHGQPLSRTEGAKLVRRVWENVWPTWKAIVAGEGGKPVDPDLEQTADRFKTAHVLTRIIAKGAEALGVLHEYDLECEVLRALLAQRRWRRGKRGAWYDRLALVLMTHYKASAEQKQEKLEEATQVCIDGLLDADTHLIYRPRLSHRLTRLENRLNLPADERHISHAELLKCETRELVAIRSAQNLGMPSGQAIGGRSAGPIADLGLNDEDSQEGSSWQVGKSAWVGRDGEVTVEGWVLEWWEDRGYEGYHAESSILTTLFALLMWPVLFHPVPGAFETYYQTAPLDLGEDTFARARRVIIEERLGAMESTDAALAMLRETDSRERDRGTWAVGLSWDFGRRELEEILTCMGGHAMALICRMLSEEYRHRASGVPDLIVWDYDKREARFVEVKGPGDSLSETQKIWIDVLLSAGVPVEVCRVKAKEDKVEPGRPGLRKSNSGTSKKEAPDSRPAMRTKRTDSGRSKRAAAKKPDPEIIVLDGSSDEDEEDEWQYESGDEGKPEGRWASCDEVGKRPRR